MAADRPGRSRPTLTVIVPCAGVQRRFDAPYPKELHRINHAESIIDHALAPVRDFAARRDASVRLVVVIRAHKADTVAYLARYADVLDTVFVYQADRHGPDLSGAVTAALPLCTGPTAVVLPDQVVTDDVLAQRFAEAYDLLARHPYAVLAATIHDPVRLANDGALRLRGRGPVRVVEHAAEKPADPSGFNAAWATVFAAAAHRDGLPGIMTGAGATALVDSPAILVDGFHNVNRVDDL
ncbi:hypothetical protein GA0074692_2104 [Micromonospora pallida]|uniref:MobA-like NTP transferase domain-containing protein n=1 Tax=Micromonospora pallida TaxID=145854 RepID=A0A1C6S9X6_9ACTN|nr:hypothetical protein [Micromonospora pallida]SCL26206.1 hypothetical protein GA0074692_2104 [Micromonospora pallida]